MNNEHRRKVLEMVEQGKISAEEACKLLDRLEHQTSANNKSAPEGATQSSFEGVGDVLEEKLHRMNEVIQSVVNKAGDYLQSGLDGLTLCSHREIRNLSVPHEAGRPLKVRTQNGAIMVEQAAVDQVEIRAELSSSAPERLFETTIVANREADGTLTLGVRWPESERKRREGCKFHIRLPDVQGLDLVTSNGAIRTQGLTGMASLATTNGPIQVEGHEGPVDALTSNGPVMLQSVNGEVKVESTNGRLQLEGISGRIQAHTTNGAVTLRLNESASGPLEIRTTNGKIDLEAGAGFQGELKMKTSNGGIKVDQASGIRIVSLDRNSAHLIVGEPSEPQCSTLGTSNGQIRVSFPNQS